MTSHPQFLWKKIVKFETSVFVFFEPDVYGKALLNIKKKGKQASFFSIIAKSMRNLCLFFSKGLSKDLRELFKG